MADIVESKVNVVHIRYFAEASAINSTFAILFTAFRPKGGKIFSDLLFSFYSIYVLMKKKITF